jgi:hypothetical protein
MTKPPTAPLQLTIWDGTRANDLPLAISQSRDVCTVRLRCLPGASGIHLAVRDAEGVRWRGELAAYPGEVVPIQVGIDDGGALYVSSRSDLLVLPVEVMFEPPPPIAPASCTAPLDIAFVIDGTLRDWTAGGQLLRARERWAAHVENLIALVSRLSEGREARAALIAFGDEDPPALMPAELRPAYHVAVSQPLLPLNIPGLREALKAVRATSGTDFVDALADALHACRSLRWGDGRKVVVVSGDSPGLSLLEPLPKGADLRARQHDVDTQTSYLYRLGVEIVTIYHAPPPESALANLTFAAELLKTARDQYTRLASLPELAFDAATFDADQAADRLARMGGVVARGAALGELTSPIAAP